MVPKINDLTDKRSLWVWHVKREDGEQQKSRRRWKVGVGLRWSDSLIKYHLCAAFASCLFINKGLYKTYASSGTCAVDFPQLSMLTIYDPDYKVSRIVL